MSEFKFHAQDIAKAIQSESHNVDTSSQLIFESVVTDTRDDCMGGLFFPIKGENFDGHKFIDVAIEKGAKGIVYSGANYTPDRDDIAFYEVSDTLVAFQNLANWLRTHIQPKVVAVTGSNGKSSTKEFASKLISQKYNCLCPEGSFNNHIGVPKTLLRLEEGTDVVIVEMGMNNPGEIASLVAIAQPDSVTVTTVGRAHIEAFGSVEGIASAKEEIYAHASEEAVKIFNLDNQWTKKMFDKYKSHPKTMTFSQFDPTADVFLREIVSGFGYIEFEGKILGEPGKARSDVFGRHNLNNLMAAACMAISAGVEADLIWKGFSHCRGMWGRNQIVSLPNGVTALFDAYNANPDSMEALLSNVSRVRVEGQIHAVFGDMLELGESSHQFHRELGQKVGEMDFESVTFVGEYGEAFRAGLESAKIPNKLIISNTYKNTLASEIWSVIQPGDVVLFKGSRGNRLERILMDMGPDDFSLKNS